MASEQGPIATESPLAPPPAPPPPTAAHPIVNVVGASEVPGSDSTRLASLKRARETTPTSPGSTGAPGDLSPSKIARLVTFAQSPLPAPLTGAAALEDERRRKEEEQRRLPIPQTSQNPTQKVLSDLISGANANMSRPQDGLTQVAPAASETTITAQQHEPTNDLPALAAADSNKATSPQSTASAAVTMASGNEQVMDSPSAMDVDGRVEQPAAPQPEMQMDERNAPTSFSYPGILPPEGHPQAPPPRGLSLPMPPAQNSDLASRSPSKKHKCPYCETEFTRHHNLKSHLLTHSQEKPYLCQTCSMRFRRLHDLKRHSKLHTGEKPHICPKCDRKFARADALARHSKGAGGCAGRRSSMGSFVGDDDYDGTDADDSNMTGIIYDAAAEGDMTEEERRRLSLPSIKAQHVASQAALGEGYAAHSRSTYPPPGPRPLGGGLLPPSANRATPSAETSPTVPNSTGSGHTPNTSISSMPLSAGSSLFSQTGMTESPKPLSPGVAQPPQQGQEKSQARSGSLQQQITARHSEQQQAPPSGLSAPPHGMSDAAQLAWLSQYPPADASKTKGAPQSATGAIPASPAQQPLGDQPRVAGAPASTTTAPGQGSGADNGNNIFASGEQGLWTYIHSLDDKLKTMGVALASVKKVEAQLLEKVGQFEQKEMALANEVAFLRSQLAIRSGGGQSSPS